MVSKVCRVCGGAELLKNFEGQTELLELLQICTNITVKSDDLLPKLVCQQCELGLQFSYNLRKKGEATEKRLRLELEAQNARQAANTKPSNSEVQSEKHEYKLLPEYSTRKGVVLIQHLNGEIVIKRKLIEQELQPKLLAIDTIDEQISLQDSDSLSNMQLDDLEFQSERPEPVTIDSYGTVTNDEKLLEQSKISSTSDVIYQGQKQQASLDLIEEILDSDDEQSDNEFIEETTEISNTNDLIGNTYCTLDEVNNIDSDMVYDEELSTDQMKNELTNIPNNSDVTVEKITTSTIDLCPSVSSYTCGTCQAVLTNQRDYREHIKIHGDERFLCTQCDKWFPSRFRLRKHELTHMDYVEHHQCTLCDRAYRMRSNLTRHIRNVHEKRRFICPTCGDVFGRPDVLKAHMTTHEEERNFKCDQCEDCFKTQRYLDSHKRKHLPKVKRKEDESNSANKNEQPAKTYNCQFCGKISKHSFTHKNHLLTHTQERPHKCETCGKAFRTLASMMAHEGIHVDARPYQCEHCLLSFRQRSHLKEHRMIHDGIAPHICSICKVSFTKKHNMQVHMRIHSGERPYKCVHCGEQFTKKVSLRRHGKSVHGEVDINIPKELVKEPKNVAEMTIVDSNSSNVELDVGREQHFNLNDDVIAIESPMENVVESNLCDAGMETNFYSDLHEEYANVDDAGVVLVVDDNAKFNSLYIMDD